MSTRIFLDLAPRRSAIFLGQNGQRGQPEEIPDPSFLDLSLTYKPPGRVNVEALNDDAGSRRRAQERTQFIDSESARNLRGQLDIELQPSNTNTEGASSSVLLVAPVAPTPPPPPPEPTYTCPICLGPIVEETTTRCGHIFCYSCIRSALSTREECPMCRLRLTRRKLRRVYFPEPL